MNIFAIHDQDMRIFQGKMGEVGSKTKVKWLIAWVELVAKIEVIGCSLSKFSLKKCSHMFFETQCIMS